MKCKAMCYTDTWGNYNFISCCMLLGEKSLSESWFYSIAWAKLWFVYNFCLYHYIYYSLLNMFLQSRSLAIPIGTFETNKYHSPGRSSPRGVNFPMVPKSNITMVHPTQNSGRSRLLTILVIFKWLDLEFH